MSTSTPSIYLAGDTARTRTSDPVTSHAAGDKSQRGLSKLRVAVLMIFAEDGEMTGSELNDDYRSWHVVDRAKFPRCHPDSPRRRAGELAVDALLDVVAHKKGVFGTEEAVYRISPEGRAVLASLNHDKEG